MMEKFKNGIFFYGIFRWKKRRRSNPFIAATATAKSHSQSLKQP